MRLHTVSSAVTNAVSVRDAPIRYLKKKNGIIEYRLQIPNTRPIPVFFLSILKTKFSLVTKSRRIETCHDIENTVTVGFELSNVAFM